MNCATLSGVRMANAIMEGAHCVNCNFQVRITYILSGFDLERFLTNRLN